MLHQQPIFEESPSEGSNTHRQKAEFIAAELRAASALEQMMDSTLESEHSVAEFQETIELEQLMDEAAIPENMLYEQQSGQNRSKYKGNGKATTATATSATSRKRKARVTPAALATRKRRTKDVVDATANNLTLSDSPTTIASTITSTTASTTTSTVVIAQQQGSQQPLTQADYDLYNALSHEEAQLKASATNKDIQATSTKNQYNYYLGHWKRWCERKKYSNAYRVTREKVLTYVTELLAPETIINEDNPHLSVIPARVHKSETYEGDPPAFETIAFYIKAIRDFYIQQCMDANVVANVAGTTHTPEVVALLEDYRNKYHEKISNSDVLQLTTGTGYSLPMFKKFLKISWTRSYKHLNNGSKTQKLIGARTRLSFVFNHFMITRGQSIRDCMVSHLFPHQFDSPDDGRQLAFAIAVAIPRGKMNQDHTLHSVYVRNKDVEICPVGCLAFYLLELWMTKESTPDFRKHDWKSHYLIFAAQRDKPMDNATLYRSQSEVMKLARYMSSKVTHAGRRAGAQHAQANGTSIEDIAQHGNWNHRRLVTRYLGDITKEVPFRMAGFLYENEHFWISRNTVIPPVELQKQIFPFIEELFPGNVDWAKWMEDIMMDRREDLDNYIDKDFSYPDEYIPAMRIMIILAHLRKVILQDAVALMDCKSDPLCDYSLHHVFTGNRVFSSTLFREFALRLRESIQNAQSPMNDSLCLNAPVLHQDLQSLKSDMASLDSFVRNDLMKAFVATATLTSNAWSRACENVHQDQMTVLRGLQTLAADFTTGLMNVAKATTSSAGHLINDVETQHNILEQQEQRQANEEMQQLTSLINRISGGQCLQEQHPQVQHPQVQNRQEQHPEEQEPDQWGADALGQQALSQQIEQDHEQPVQVEAELENQGQQGQEKAVNEAYEAIALEHLADSIAGLYVQLPICDIKSAAANFSMLPRNTLLDPLWEEWFSAKNGKPSIWSLNRYQKGWREGWKGNLRNIYMLKNRIIYATLKEVKKAEGSDLMDRVLRAKAVMNARMEQAGGTPNALFKTTQKRKKKAD